MQLSREGERVMKYWLLAAPAAISPLFNYRDKEKYGLRRLVPQHLSEICDVVLC
jgi:hypothetical protein